MAIRLIHRGTDAHFNHSILDLPDLPRPAQAASPPLTAMESEAKAVSPR
ncbi:MAG: hypothetical protein AB2813_04685 [Candidatus Sedimenticola endophacoides]